MRTQGVCTRTFAEYVEKEICWKAPGRGAHDQYRYNGSGATDDTNCYGAIFSRWAVILRKRGQLLKQILRPAGLTTPLILYLSGRTDCCVFGEVRRTVRTGQVLEYVRFRKRSCICRAI